MRARLTLAAGTAALALAGSVFAVPAFAAPCDTSGATGTCFGKTQVTVLNGVAANGAGTLALTGALPTAVLAADTLSAPIGTMVVTDTRATAGSWDVQVSATNFTLSGTGTGGNAASVIPASASSIKIAQVTSPIANAVSALQLQIPGTSTVTDNTSASGVAADGLPLSTTGVTVLHAVTANANVFPYIPTLTIHGSSYAAGLYTGTVTQSVS